MGTGPANLICSSVPPVKSTLRFALPRETMHETEKAESHKECGEDEHLVSQAHEIDLRLLCDLSKFHQILRLLGLYLTSIQSKMVFEPKTAVKRLIMMPMASVTAKPFMGPVPKMKRMKVVMSVVIWASKIVTHAFE